MNNQDIKRVGLKITGPRVKIFTLLDQARPKHLSAEIIYQRLREQGEDVGLATVYRVLAQFESAGLVRRHLFDGGHAVYELETGHHDHLVCSRCGTVKEFIDAMIEKRQAEIATAEGFLVSEHQHTIYGVCKRCQ